LDRIDSEIFNELEILEWEGRRSVRDLGEKVMGSFREESGSMVVGYSLGGGNGGGTEEDTQGESGVRSEGGTGGENTIELEKEAKKKVLEKSELKNEVNVETGKIKECSEALESSPVKTGEKGVLYDKTDGVYKIVVDTGDAEQEFDKKLKKVARKSMLNFLDMFTGGDDDKKKKKRSKKDGKTKTDTEEDLTKLRIKDYSPGISSVARGSILSLGDLILNVEVSPKDPKAN
jgi:hypothetical protein